MSFPRFLAAGVVVSLVLHGSGAAFFAGDPDEVSIAASQGGGVSVIGSIEDLVAGAQVDQVADMPPVEEVEPVTEPLGPVAAPVAVARTMQETPVNPVEVMPAQPVAEPLPSEVTSNPSKVGPAVEGVTLADPVTAASPAAIWPTEIMPSDELPQTGPVQAAAVPPVEEVKPIDSVPVESVRVESAKVEPHPHKKPVGTVSLNPNGTPSPVEPVTPEAELPEAAPDPLLDVKQIPRTRPVPPVRRSEPRKVAEKVKTAQNRGAETSTRKGGERITSKTARANANGRADAQSGDGGTRAASNYKGKVVAKLRRAKRYPREARRQNLEGTVHVAFTIAANGSVSGIRITRSSGHPVLDQAAVEMVQRAAPMPKFPSDIRAGSMNLQAPVRFDR